MFKRLFSVVIIFCAIFFNLSAGKVQARDVYMGENYNGTYWAISESLEHGIDECGDEDDFCEIDFKIVSRYGNYSIYHCKMWSDGGYRINNGEKHEPEQYPHPMYHLYRYTLDRIQRGDFRRTY